MAVVISDSDSDVELEMRSPAKPPPKRRRIIDPSTIKTVSIYSNKVNSSLQLKPAVFKQADCTVADTEEASLWSPSPPHRKRKPISVSLSDSEEEPEHDKPQEVICCPSPPPPPSSPPVQQTKRVNKKIREINKKLDAIGSLLSPSPKHLDITGDDCPSSDDEYDDDDIIIVSDQKRKKKPPSRPRGGEKSREISLKFRCRTEVYKIPVLSTAPLSKAVDQLCVILKVPPTRILLLRKDVELPVHSTANELDLGIADIIDCVVITEDKQEEGDVITVRLQGKEKGSAQEYSLHKDEPLGSILSQHLSHLSPSAKRKVRFLFDGSKVTHNQTPSELDMEDGDVIEVWA